MGFIDSRSEKSGFLYKSWPKAQAVTGWCIGGLDPAKAWVVPSTSTNMTLDKGGRPTNLCHAKAMEQEAETVLLRLVGGLREEKMLVVYAHSCKYD